jgi:hypothetical protein
LANSDVDAEEGLGGVASLVGSLLVKDCVNSNGGLASLAIADDELTLSTADGDL